MDVDLIRELEQIKLLEKKAFNLDLSVNEIIQRAVEYYHSHLIEFVNMADYYAQFNEVKELYQNGK